MGSKGNEAILIFTAGPVQGFVGQARRTRDLWAGSWLLSYLSESALVAAEEVGGRALIPCREGQAGQITSRNTPIGGYPNRFVVGFMSTEDAKEGGRKARAAFIKRWSDIADMVWQKFVKRAAGEHGFQTEEIWRRQIESFWELSWVVGDSIGKAGRQAAARKAFRNSPCEIEEGFKCSLIGTHQEVSGQYSRSSREDRELFWNSIRSSAGTLDLKEAEYLCAISLIKRLYPKVLNEVEEQTSWPSTSFVAASSWLRSLEGKAQERAESYAAQARALGIDRSEMKAAGELGLRWADIDAQAWFPGGLSRNEWDLSETDLQELQQKLKELYRESGGGPVPFFSLLVMDGDSLGKLLEKLGDPGRLSRALKKFADRVDGCVRSFYGRTVYAGGDDVLALVAPDKALETAQALNGLYRESFSDTEAAEEATISGSLIFCPLHLPLTETVRMGHQTLDEVAKERTGRDALAIAIVLGSGLSALWSAPWDVIDGKKGLPALNDFVHRFGKADLDSEKLPSFNASFLYGLRDQYAKLFPKPVEEPGLTRALAFEDSENVLLDLAHSEYRRRLSSESAATRSLEETRGHVEELMMLSHRWWRDQGEVKCDRQSFSFDGWRVARFLKQLKEGEVTLRG